MLDESLQSEGRAREKQMMERQAIEEIGVAEVKAQIVAFEDTPTLEENVVLLSADRALSGPFLIKGNVVGEAFLPLGPSAQRLGFSSL